MPAQPLTDRPVAPAYRPFPVRVSAARRLSPSFRRITFTGPDLDRFPPGGADQRLKVLLPPPEATSGWAWPRSLLAEADWYARWRALPPDGRPVMRTYTVRAARPSAREVDVDFVLHGGTGPASAWAERAAAGDEAVLIGPNACASGPVGGSEWRPPASPRALVLAGDETAVPALCAIAEGLPPGTGARVLLEVPGEDDVLEVLAPPDVRLTWLPRTGAASAGRGAPAAPRGSLLAAAVRAVADELGLRSSGAEPEALSPDEPVWEVPDAPAPAGAYAWLAGEASVVAELRRDLLGRSGFDRRSVAFMGYWRRGRPEVG